MSLSSPSITMKRIATPSPIQRSEWPLDQFVADCRDACAVDKSHKLVREVLCRAGADPSGVLKALGEPTRGAIKTLYRSDDLTKVDMDQHDYDVRFVPMKRRIKVNKTERRIDVTIGK